ncbi:hypothetical protein GJAV_G00049410 [Gymnothorax javanicus]|nr:hypothetical protein GJAV_G00049410 [Gymnothorax javanicus]
MKHQKIFVSKSKLSMKEELCALRNAWLLGSGGGCFNMADVMGGGSTAGIFWIKDTSDEDQPMVFVPGVSREGNLCPGLKPGSAGSVSKGKMRIGSGSEVKGIVGVGGQLEGRKSQFQRPCCQDKTQSRLHSTQAKAELQSASTVRTSFRSPVLSPTKPTPFYANPQAVVKAAQARSSTTLKDLCPEDKRRIANLIQELARVSEEKDETQQRLRDEQESFERKIQQLEEQNQLIVQERESLQQQYRECQELLALYQRYLSQQQEKLNQSIAQLNQSHSKSLPKVSDRAVTQPLRGGAPGMDGSYLGLPNVAKAGASHKVWPRTDDVRMTTPIQLSSSSGRGSDPGEGGSQTRGRSEPRPGQQTGSSRRCVRSENGRQGLERGVGGGPSPASPSPHVRTSTAVPSTHTPVATAPPVCREDWDERRHWLLRQKVELEVQREKLQAQLAQQEERLFLHNQKLRQTRADRGWVRDGGAEPELPSDRAAHGRAAEPTPPARLAADAETETAPSGSEDLDRIPAQDGELLQLQGETATPPLGKSLLLRESPAVSRKDAATSPVVAKSKCEPAPPSASGPALPRTPDSSLNSSLIELLDLFSPILAPIQRRKASQPRGKYHTPTSSSLLPPHRASRHRAPPHRSPCRRSPTASLDDTLESQILEDIFFIC